MSKLLKHTCGKMPRVQGSTKYEPGLFALYRREVPNFDITCERCGVSIYGGDYQEAAERWNAMMEFVGRAKVNADNPITWREAYDDLAAKYGSAMRDLYDHAATIEALREKLAKAEARVAELERQPDPYCYEIMGKLVTEGEYYKSKYEHLKKERERDQSVHTGTSERLAAAIKALNAGYDAVYATYPWLTDAYRKKLDEFLCGAAEALR